MTNYILTNDGELKHYGVVGMKWGVRKNPAKAYFKAHKKLRKLEKNRDYWNSDKAMLNAHHRSRMKQLGITDGYGYGSKYRTSVNPYETVFYNRLRSKKVVERWQKQMDKAFKDVDPKYIKEGERLLAEYDKKKSKKK